VIVDITNNNDHASSLPSSKRLSFVCPHPKSDAETGEQGIRLLKGTCAQSWIVSGSHRKANYIYDNDNTTTNNNNNNESSIYSTCQPSHNVADSAHNVNNGLTSAVIAIHRYYDDESIKEDYTSIQLHGMGNSSCGTIDTFLTHGSCTAPPQKTNSSNKIKIIQKLAQSYEDDFGHHAVTGIVNNHRSHAADDDDRCKLCGSDNIQGRLINGVEKGVVCTTRASSLSGKFIHLEQKRFYRSNTKTQFWIDIINDAYIEFSKLSATTSSDQEKDNVCKSEK
jgi:hypothetical protein